MVYYNQDQKRFVYFYYKIKYKDDERVCEDYVNNISEYQRMVENTPTLSNFEYEVIKSNKEQDERLQVLNSLKNIEPLLGFTKLMGDFVQFGYVDKNYPEPLKSIRDKYEETTKAYLVSEYKKLLSKYKTEKEQSECNFNGSVIATDMESQSKITGTFISLQSGLLNSVNFKAKSGWITLNKDEFTRMVSIVALHVQTCFNAEEHCYNEIKNMSVDQLLDLDPEFRVDNISSETVNKLLEYYNATYTTMFLQAQAKAKQVIDTGISTGTKGSGTTKSK